MEDKNGLKCLLYFFILAFGSGCGKVTQHVAINPNNSSSMYNQEQNAGQAFAQRQITAAGSQADTTTMTIQGEVQDQSNRLIEFIPNEFLPFVIGGLSTPVYGVLIARQLGYKEWWVPSVTAGVGVLLITAALVGTRMASGLPLLPIPLVTWGIGAVTGSAGLALSSFINMKRRNAKVGDSHINMPVLRCYATI